MYDAAAYYWQTPQTSQIKQNHIDKQQQDPWKAQKGTYFFRSFRILKHFSVYFKAEQFKILNDSRALGTALIWLPGLTQVEESILILILFMAEAAQSS